MNVFGVVVKFCVMFLWNFSLFCVMKLFSFCRVFGYMFMCLEMMKFLMVRCDIRISCGFCSGSGWLLQLVIMLYMVMWLNVFMCESIVFRIVLLMFLKYELMLLGVVFLSILYSFFGFLVVLQLMQVLKLSLLIMQLYLFLLLVKFIMW